jgi:hypothetical protein
MPHHLYQKRLNTAVQTHKLILSDIIYIIIIIIIITAALGGFWLP